MTDLTENLSTLLDPGRLEEYIRELDEKSEKPKDIWGPPYQTIVFILHSDRENFWGHKNPFRTTLIGFLSEQAGEKFLDGAKAKNPEKYKDYYLHPFTLRDLAIYVDETRWNSADIFYSGREGANNIGDMSIKRINFVRNKPKTQEESTFEVTALKTLTLLRFELITARESGMSSMTHFLTREPGATCTICGRALPEGLGVETILAGINPSEEKAVAEILRLSGKSHSFQSPTAEQRLVVLSSCDHKECRSRLEYFGKDVNAHGGKISRSILGVGEVEEKKPDYYYKRDYPIPGGKKP